MSRTVIMDVDTGTDDAVAIMFAALHPDLDLVGVTTVSGNQPVAVTTDNTLRVLDWVGRSDVPVFAGLSRPIVRSGFPGERHFAGGSGRDPHGGTLPIPEPVSAVQDSGAVEYLVQTLRATRERITLVAVGPLSNVAAALAIDPSLVNAVDELVIMGGSHAIANVTASAEFNIWADPEAASAVFSAGFERLTLVTLDATHQALVTRATCDELATLGTPAGTAAARFVGRRIDAYAPASSDDAAWLAGRADGRTAASDAAPVHDVLCTAYLVRPDVVSTRLLNVQVETSGQLTVGRTVIDTRPDTGTEPNAHVALSADAQLLNHLLIDVFSPASRMA